MDHSKNPLANQVYMYHGLLRIDVIGDQTGASVRAMGEQIETLISDLRNTNRAVLILDNVTGIGKANSDALRNVAILARVLDYDKATMVGDGSALMRTTTNIMLKTIGRANTRYFDTIEAAEAWLRL